MDIASSVDRIRATAMAKPASQRAGYVAENIRRQQEMTRRFVEAKQKPAGWSVEKAEAFIHGLIGLQNEFAEARRVAA